MTLSIKSLKDLREELVKKMNNIQIITTIRNLYTKKKIMNYPNHYSYTRKLNSKLTTRGVYKIYMDIKYEEHNSAYSYVYVCVCVYTMYQCIYILIHKE